MSAFRSDRKHILSHSDDRSGSSSLRRLSTTDFDSRGTGVTVSSWTLRGCGGGRRCSLAAKKRSLLSCRVRPSASTDWSKLSTLSAKEVYCMRKSRQALRSSSSSTISQSCTRCKISSGTSSRRFGGGRCIAIRLMVRNASVMAPRSSRHS